MIIDLALTALHIFSLFLALPAVWRRARTLLGALDKEALQRAVRADTIWGLAVGLWLLTGVARIIRSDAGFAGAMNDGLFLIKMGLFGLLLALEILPMFLFMRWRAFLSRGALPDLRAAPAIARISQAQLVLLILTTAVAVIHAFDVPI